MTIFQKNNSQPSNNIDYKESELIAVRVKDIILDITHPFAKMFGGYDAIGTINFTPLDKDTPLEAPWVKGHNAVPFFSFIIPERFFSSSQYFTKSPTFTFHLS